ncbi:MAG: hypothetical protein MJZ34_02945 [Paludibacteraceae bacterium]|nr:hypothetical protein [Paludibacteraceae bacterium]
MYADFIEDRLAENSEYIRLLKLGIKLFQPEWLESNFRQLIKRENYQIIDSFFDNLKEEISDEEKLFIYKSVYAQAGFRESLLTLGNFIDGLEIKISDLDDDTDDANPKRKGVAYRDLLEFKWDENNKRYVADISEFGQFLVIKYSYVKDAVYTDMKNLRVDATVLCALTKANSVTDVVITTESRDDKTVLLFNGSPYLNTVVPTNSNCEFYLNNQMIEHIDDLWEKCEFVKKDEVASSYLGEDMYYAIWDRPIPTLIKYVDAKDIFKLELDKVSRSKLYIYPYDNNYNNLKSHEIAIENSENVGFDFFPYIQDGNTGKEFPPLNTNKIFTYNIEVRTNKDIFKDYDLMQSQIENLVRELLFYKDTVDIGYPKLTFDTFIVNKITNTLDVLPKIFRFFVITEDNSSRSSSNENQLQGYNL